MDQRSKFRSQSSAVGLCPCDAVVVQLTFLGYLGAGKTTLMNYILQEEHGKRIAVILNGMYIVLL